MGKPPVSKARTAAKARALLGARACKPCGKTDMRPTATVGPQLAYSTSAYCALGVKSYTTRVICFSSAMMRVVTRSSRS